MRLGVRRGRRGRALVDHRAASVVVDVEELHLELIGFTKRERRVHLEATATIEDTLNRVLEALDAAGLEREDPLREQMRRHLAAVPGGVASYVADVVSDEVGRPRGNLRRDDRTRDLGGRLVGLPRGALHGDERGTSKGAEHRPLMEDVTRRYRHIDSPDSTVRWSRLPPDPALYHLVGSRANPVPLLGFLDALTR